MANRFTKAVEAVIENTPEDAVKMDVENVDKGLRTEITSEDSAYINPILAKVLKKPNKPGRGENLNIYLSSDAIKALVDLSAKTGKGKAAIAADILREVLLEGGVE